MAKCIVTFETDNAAFDDDLGGEVTRILRDLANATERGIDMETFFVLPIYDLNGNEVGRFIYTR